jgi:hypothetical protein
MSFYPQMDTDYEVFLRAGLSLAISREGAKDGGRVSPRAAFRCAEGWEGRASLVRGQADACPSLRFARPMMSTARLFYAKAKVFWGNASLTN